MSAPARTTAQPRPAALRSWRSGRANLARSQRLFLDMPDSHAATQPAQASRASDDSRRHRLPDRRIHCGLHRPGGYVLCSHGNAVPGNFEEPSFRCELLPLGNDASPSSPLWSALSYLDRAPARVATAALRRPNEGRPKLRCACERSGDVLVWEPQSQHALCGHRRGQRHWVCEEPVILAGFCPA
jgi:hypothetical protein